MSDLFPVSVTHAPLADALRPQNLEEVVGQSHLLGRGKPLRIAFESGKPHSMILWGPPGTGKTTLARLMAKSFDAEFIAISAVLGGVKDIRDAVEKAQRVLQQSGRRTILFVDEVHRFNKAQQDAFLPYVEQGVLTFIGATTENPSFEVNNALLSRAQVYVLHALSEPELGILFERAKIRALSEVEFTPEAKTHLLSFADGDARRLLNLVEQIANSAETTSVKKVDQEYVQSVLVHALRIFDKGGDAFYDQISALHKSVRGSDPDASLYWFTRMLDGGADPRYIGRRMIRMASEDIGLADPRALRIVLDAVETYERLGSPEGELALAEAIIFLAVAPKSNSVYMAYNNARRWVANDGSKPVPEHLRNAPTKLMKNLGYGKDYRYAHDEPDAYAAGENYFPEGMERVDFYQPSSRGLEAKISERLAHLRELDAERNQKKK